MFYQFKIAPHIDPEEAQLELEKKGLQDTFILEDGDVYIGGHAPQEIVYEWGTLVKKERNEVDWESQWAEFSPNFREGKAHIPIQGRILKLLPGPGFGDLSHPTTCLMIEMMEGKVHQEHIVDLGCGSGILTLASLLMGAQSALGIDIDPEAISHARQNQKLNDLPALFSDHFALKHPSIFLLNMTAHEQEVLSPKRYNGMAKLWIVSGILDAQKETYLNQTKLWLWEVVEERKKGDWLGFIFKKRGNTPP